ncbi:sulfonate ABC transporter ATP-binding protein [Aminobacter sp. Y103A]|nr:sulfonate ABC transporter ATP-binding protein [Aminobacter sp. SS-2016]
MTSIDSGHRGEVSIRDLSKSFAINGRPLAVLKGLNLDIRAGECLVIVGASGSGKTTLLRVLAGLEVADGGRVAIDGEPVHGVGSDRAVIFQEPRLLPWLTVATSPSASRCVAKTAPAPRSGRALTVQPEILLLDEPLGALDAMTKITMQEELARIWSEENVTMVMVTHDLEEAVYLADRVLVLPKEKGAAARLIDIELRRPRDRSEPRFVRYREELLHEFGLH